MRDDVLDPGRAAAAGGAFGQLASAPPAGGLLLASSRLVEIGARATVLLAPGLFRLDLTPQEETLGVLTRPLTRDPVHWRADESAWDGYRDAGGGSPRSSCAGASSWPTAADRGRVQVLSIADSAAARGALRRRRSCAAA